MPSIARFLQFNAPGVYVSEGTYGSIPADIATHDTVYVLGTASNPNLATNTPTFISNYEDFVNRVGSSPSAAAVASFFAQKSGKGLYFVNVAKRVQRTLSGASFVAGTTATITINGNAISYTLGGSETATTVANAIGAKINQQLAGIAIYYPSSGIIRTNPTDTVAVNSVLTLGAASSVGSYPTAFDVVDSANNTFVPENLQGFLCAPEFYQAYASQSERTTLQTQLDAFCSQPAYYWVNVVDCGQTVATTTVGNGSIDAMSAEVGTYVSPRGNSFVYYPYLIDLNDTVVPASLACIGAGLRRARGEGIYQPFAGTKYPLYGVKDTTFRVTAVGQGVLNPKGVNCVRSLPGKGIVCYGARTVSPNPYYKFAATRIILNLLAGTLRKAYDDTIFTLVDGVGALFARVRGTADVICENLRLAGALYGATPEDAYLNICDSTNNTGATLETGMVYLDTIVKPSPTLEALSITLSRSALGEVLAQVKSSGDTAPTEQTTPANGK